MRTAAHCLWLTIASLTLAACGKPEAPPEAPRPVRYVVAGQTGQQQGDSYAGEIRARHETNLAFRVTGTGVAKLANSGDREKKAQVPRRLDARPHSREIARR
ncbi:efflux RND transporter periplasmic adaptor subunit, partial [Pseudomonas sp. MWU13-2860]